MWIHAKSDELINLDHCIKMRIENGKVISALWKDAAAESHWSRIGEFGSEESARKAYTAIIEAMRSGQVVFEVCAINEEA